MRGDPGSGAGRRRRRDHPARPARGQNIRRAGEDLQAGQPAIPAGKLLRPAEIGIIASLGIGEVSVRRRVRVALFSTGDELCSIGTPLSRGAVYDSNRYTLWGMLTRLGCEVIDMGVVQGRSGRARSGLPRSGRLRRRDHHQRRRLGRRGRFHQAADGAARRSGLLENRHEARPADGLRPDRQTARMAPGCSACRATRWR